MNFSVLRAICNSVDVRSHVVNRVNSAAFDPTISMSSDGGHAEVYNAVYAILNPEWSR